MKTNRSRAGVLGLAVVGLLAASWLLPPMVHQYKHLCPVRPDGVPQASAYANFARRYGVDCSVCHASYPQLNTTGAKFRMAGYRMPDEIGNDAKWSNWGDNAAVKVRESWSLTSTQGNKTSSPETNGFSSGGMEMFPWEGAVGKYTAVNSEVDFTAAGAVSMGTLNLIATLPVNKDAFVTLRTGLMSQFWGYGASDRAVGALSPTFLPTPSQIQPGGTKSFTYNGFNKAGEGVEAAYNWKDTHVSAQVTNGYNASKASTQQGQSDHYYDYSLFLQQMIGENAVAAHFYRGTTGYVTDPSAAQPAAPFDAKWYDNYARMILYGTLKFLPADKLDLLLGFADGVDHVYDVNTRESSDQFHSMGMFATLQSVQHMMNHQLTSALSYGTNRKSTSTGGNRVSDVTLSFAVPVENSKFDVSFQGRRTQQVGSQDVTGYTSQAQWEFMF